MRFKTFAAGLALLLLVHLSPGARGGQQINVSRDVPYVDVPAGVDAKLLSLDIYAPASASSLPVILMVHGGAWRTGDKANDGVAATKSRFFGSHGYVFVSMNYRLAPEVTPAEQAAEVAQALAFLRDHVARYGGDPTRLVLMGHSAGAHLAALVATDPHFLSQHKMTRSALRAVILRDGAAYNLPHAMERLRPRARELYTAAFGSDPLFWARCSPLAHVGESSLPPFLVFHAGARESSRFYSEELAQAIEQAGGRASVVAVAEKNHAEINKELGAEGDVVGPEVLRFLESL